MKAAVSIIKPDAPGARIFGIMARVRVYLKEADRADEWPAVQRRMVAGSYEELCRVASEVIGERIR